MSHMCLWLPSLPQAFFAGVVLCRLLDYFADALIHLINKFSRTRSTDSSADLCAVAAVAEQQLCSMHDSIHANPKDASHKGLHASKDGTTSDLEQADAFSTGAGVKVQHGLSISQDGSSGSEPALAIITTAPPEDDHDRAVAAAVGQLQDESCGHLVRTSILVWLALSLHNIPEGLATFVG
jgi:zinc transporter ZupT